MRNLFRQSVMPKLHLCQKDWDNGTQTWVKRVYLMADKELKKTDDWTVGFYFCESCKKVKGFAYKLPPIGEVSKECKNDWIDWLIAHAHGDGRVILFERKEP